MLRRLIAVSTAAALAACATLAQPDQMVSTGGTPLPSASPLRAAVMPAGVNLVPGDRAASMPSGVTGEDFAEALRETLMARGMLALSKPRFMLFADILKLDQRAHGDVEVTVSATVRYEVSKPRSSQTLFEATIKSSFTADWHVSLKPGERLQLATEGAMRENIRQFAEQLIAASQSGAAFGSSD